VEKELFVGEAMTPDATDKSQVPVKVAARVDVLPPSSEAIGAVIESLGKQLFATDDVVANEATQALTMTKDDRVVPYFAKLIDSPNQSQRIYGVWGLRPYGTDDALAALKKALTIHELELAAAQTLADNPHPKAWDTLWVLRGDPDENVRLTVLHALAKQNLPDEVARLQSFTKDASSMVSGEAKRYLRERKK
jgi:HEAT repeat protein